VIFQFLVPVRRISRDVERGRHHPPDVFGMISTWACGMAFARSMTTAKTDKPATTRLILHADLVVVCRYVAGLTEVSKPALGVRW
jgi:hypothetical protein